MKAYHHIVVVTLLVIGVASIMNWIRGGASFNIVHALPFLGGRPPGPYDLGGVALLLITLWGLARLWRNRGNDE